MELLTQYEVNANFTQDLTPEEIQQGLRSFRWWEPILYVGLGLVMLIAQIIISGTHL
jgi:hypothetical protein